MFDPSERRQLQARPCVGEIASQQTVYRKRGLSAAFAVGLQLSDAFALLVLQRQHVHQPARAGAVTFLHDLRGDIQPAEVLFGDGDIHQAVPTPHPVGGQAVGDRIKARLRCIFVQLQSRRQGGQGLIVGAPAVSDALTQGTPTAGYSLVSRDVAADCFEIGHYAHHGDAMIVISGCDKTGAAALMPLARTNAFGLVLYPAPPRPAAIG